MGGPVDLVDSAITIAKACYYYDLRDLNPEKVILFDDIPLKSQLRYFSQASYILDELGVSEDAKKPDAPEGTPGLSVSSGCV